MLVSDGCQEQVVFNVIVAEAETWRYLLKLCSVMWMRTQLQGLGFNYNKNYRCIATLSHAIKYHATPCASIPYQANEYQLADMLLNPFRREVSVSVRRIGLRCFDSTELESPTHILEILQNIRVLGDIMCYYEDGNLLEPASKQALGRYQVYQGRLLASFQDDAKYEHVGQDTRSQGGKDDQDKQGNDLKISDIKTKSKDNDKG
ncbi:hypothetical protein Tco_0780996 [Tanacetum coccineum]